MHRAFPSVRPLHRSPECAPASSSPERLGSNACSHMQLYPLTAPAIPTDPPSLQPISTSPPAAPSIPQSIDEVYAFRMYTPDGGVGSLYARMDNRDVKMLPVLGWEVFCTSYRILFVLVLLSNTVHGDTNCLALL